MTGLEAVVAPGELVQLGGPMRKDVAGYDLKQLLIGSEGTLGVVTAAWLRLIPAPEAALPVVGFYAECAAVRPRSSASSARALPVAALEYLDAETHALRGPDVPGRGARGRVRGARRG